MAIDKAPHGRSEPKVMDKDRGRPVAGKEAEREFHRAKVFRPVDQHYISRADQRRKQDERVAETGIDIGAIAQSFRGHTDVR